jgi:hypothetical protein
LYVLVTSTDSRLPRPIGVGRRRLGRCSGGSLARRGGGGQGEQAHNQAAGR